MSQYKLTIKAEQNQFEEARLFIVEGLKELHVADQMILENELVFEELLMRIIEQYEADTDINISLVKRIGEVKILISFSGDRFNIDFSSVEEYNPSTAILSKYEDKIGMNYRKRCNHIGILAKRTYDRMGFMCLFAILLAIVSYAAMDLTLSPATVDFIYDKVILPLEMMFGNALIMIAAPVTFLSLVTNITKCYIIADNRISLSRLGVRIMIPSFFAEILAVGYFVFLRTIVSGDIIASGAEYNEASSPLSEKFWETIYNIVPEDIFKPFMDISPMPMIFVAIVTSAAMCTMNKHFDTVKELGDGITELFCRALSLIMACLPIAAFLSITDVLMYYGYKGIGVLALIVLILIGGNMLMIIFIGVRVAFQGINPVSFLKSCWPAMKENFKINSSIDAVPYNIRFCAKTFGVSVNKLDMEIPIFAQVNQIGNGFVIMSATLVLMYYTNIPIDIHVLIMLTILVFFISIGAPGQDGSLIIGLIIAFAFVGISFKLITVIIYIEVFLGRSLPVLNTLFDIATTVSGDRKEKGKESKCQQ